MKGCLVAQADRDQSVSLGTLHGEQPDAHLQRVRDAATGMVGSKADGWPTLYLTEWSLGG